MSRSRKVKRLLSLDVLSPKGKIARFEDYQLKVKILLPAMLAGSLIMWRPFLDDALRTQTMNFKWTDISYYCVRTIKAAKKANGLTQTSAT